MLLSITGKQVDKNMILRFSHFGSRALAVVAVVAIGAFGAYKLGTGRAAIPVATIQAESGTISTSAAINADATASNSKAVRFAATANTTDPVIAVVGDIGYIDSTYKNIGNQQATANFMKQYAATTAAIIEPGDICYYNGKVSDCNTYYVPYWGQFKSITKPAPGNHDYNTSGAPGYFGYFGVQPYYSFNIGTWHLVSLNSQIDHSSSSTQNTWLKNDLASTNAKCVLAYAHYPRFVSGGKYGPGLSDMTPLWQTMFNAHGDVFAAGHSHTYERFKPQDPSGALNAAGITEFVQGVGGADLVSGTSGTNTAKQINNNYGILFLTLHATSYDFKFINLNNQVLDSGTNSCV